ncbi:MAG TPA: hypothetical protein GXX56_09100 [Rhodocyclaceae bacterium]|nr:hypothetical protein [Rhodocyclaceae bacterium]
MARKIPLAGKQRFPRSTKFPSEKEVQQKAKVLGLDLVAEEPGQESSPELTAWYVQKFCSANNLKSSL